jgi:hypothetical protein
MEVLAEYLMRSIALVLRCWSPLILVWVLLALRLLTRVRVRCPMGDSPSNSWMSSRSTPRYGLLVLVSWSSSCHHPLYRVTALAFCPVCAGGLNKRTSYPRLFPWSSADTNVILSLDAYDRGLLRATCVSSSQTRVLLVSLELAVVE